MRWRSFRVRLTLWNAAILTLVLGVFGVALAYSVQLSMLRAIDEELAAQARRFASAGFPGPRGRSPRGEGGGRGERSRRPPSDFPELDTLEEEERARLALRRPRFLAPQGDVLGRPGDVVGPWDPEAFREALAGRPVHSTVRAGDERVRVLSVPWRRGEETVGVVQVARELREYDRLRARQLKIFLLLLPPALLAAVAGGFFLTDRALRPVRQVTHAADEIGAEDLSRRLEVTGDDELADLARTFNRMIARLEEAFTSREEAYRRLSAAYEQQRRFTSDASHELRTPLARIKGSTSLALSGERTPAEYRRALARADRAADVMTRLIQDLFLLACSDAGHLGLQLRTVDLRSVLEDALSQLPEEAAARVRVELPDAPLAISADPPHLARVFVNLLENAVRHTPPEGGIYLRARAEGGQVLAEVADEGEGIAPEHLPHLFERFYRVEVARSRQGGGTGLGLAISRSIVEAHGGEIRVRSEPGQGAVFTVTIPAAGPPAG
ncbi:MAG: ATP-binding protein [Armatimonadota bacterium]